MRFAPITQLGVTAEGDPPAPTPLCPKGGWQTQSLSPSICNKKYSETQVGINERKQNRGERVTAVGRPERWLGELARGGLPISARVARSGGTGPRPEPLPHQTV
jgi:hypothetical protein